MSRDLVAISFQPDIKARHHQDLDIITTTWNNVTPPASRSPHTPNKSLNTHCVRRASRIYFAPATTAMASFLTIAKATAAINSRPWLASIMKPLSEWYVNAAGYRKLGLRYDDLLDEENDLGQMALKRLSPTESYDRIFRLRRAMQCSLQQKILSEAEWTKPEEDVPYLSPIMAQLETEIAEKKALDSLSVIKKN